MNEESLNWFRFSRLIIDVGTDVLRKLVEENAQTPFLNDLVYFWLEKVQQIKDKRYALRQWGRFHEDLKNKEETCRSRLQSLLESWRLPVGKKLTFSEQVSTVEKWKNDIESELLSSEDSNDEDTLTSWLEQIAYFTVDLNETPTILQKWTTCFLLLCQKSRQDLIEIIEKYFDDFLSSSRDKVLESRFSFKKDINKLESDRKKRFKTWQKVSERYFRSVGENIRDLLMSWRKETVFVYMPELKKLLDELETEASEINETNLQKSCNTWHQELHNLFEKWLKQIDESDGVLHPYDPSLSGGLRELFLEELRQFPSIRSQQVRDFFVSEIPKKKLHKLKQTKQLSDQQYDKLCPSSSFPDLKVFDTTLLFIVLRNCLVYPPVQGWNEDPLETDQSLGADILRLKSCIKHIVTHSEETKIYQKKYDRLWFYVRNVLCRLASRSGHKYEEHISMEVDRMKTCSLNLETEFELRQILTWCKDEIMSEFKGMGASPSCLNMLETIKRVERQRFSRMNESTESYIHDMQIDAENTESYSDDMLTDEENTESYSHDMLTDEDLNYIPQERLGHEERGVRGKVAAAVGGAIRFVRGIGRTLFKIKETTEQHNDSNA